MNPEEAIRTLLRTKWKDMTPKQICSGSCDNFAQDIADMIGHGEMVWLEDEGLLPEAHAAYRLDNQYYDAMNPNGFIPLHQEES